MKSLFKLTLLFVVSVLGMCLTRVYGAAWEDWPRSASRSLSLIPVSFNPLTRDYSILLRKPAHSDVFVPFTFITNSLLNVGNVSQYMRSFSEQTFGVYLPDTGLLSHSKRAFTYEGETVNEQSLQGFIFIEVPFIPGDTLFRKARLQEPNSNVDFAWIPARRVLELKEGQKYTAQAGVFEPGVGHAIESKYLKLLKLMIPKLQERAKLQKVLHILPVSYDSSAGEFSVLLIQPGGVYKAVTVNFDSTEPVDYPALCMRRISEQTYRAYRSEVTQDIHIGQIFNAAGNPVTPEDVEGYVYIEIPYIRGRDIWQTARRYLGMDPGTNYNWVPRSVIAQTRSWQPFEGGNGPIDENLLNVLKKTFPLLKRQGATLILKAYETEQAASAAAARECPVCLEPKDLKMLPCGHLVCAECLAKIEQTNPICPICRQRIAR